MLKTETIPLGVNNLHNIQISPPIRIKTFINPIKPHFLTLTQNKYTKNDFETLQDKSIGNGTFGSVWKVRNKITKEICAIKVIDMKIYKNKNKTPTVSGPISFMRTFITFFWRNSDTRYKGASETNSPSRSSV